MATGRGAKPIAGVSSYCVGNLHIPGYPLPWEEGSNGDKDSNSKREWKYASNLASPLDIEVRTALHPFEISCFILDLL